MSIDQALGNGARKIRYLYDFGDNWDHNIVVEKTMSTGGIATVPKLSPAGAAHQCPPPSAVVIVLEQDLISTVRRVIQ